MDYIKVAEIEGENINMKTVKHIDKLLLRCGYKNCLRILGTIETPAQIVGLGNTSFEDKYIVALCEDHWERCV